MAELSRRPAATTPALSASDLGGTESAHSTTHLGDFGSDAGTVRELRARIAELERLLDARTQAIVGLGARIVEMEGHASAPLAGRVRELERELAQLRGTKVLRYSAIPRRWYGRVRRRGS